MRVGSEEKVRTVRGAAFTMWGADRLEVRVRQHLLVDGDDTLWENNVYFERTTAAFIDFLDHSTLAHDEVRRVLDEIERGNGYGTAAFARSLEATYRRLVEREVSAEDVARVHAFADMVRAHPMEVLAGVEETLAYLAARHDVVLVTKGDVDEQRLKIEASGLEGYFRQTVIVPEKDVATYRRLVVELEIAAEQAWMIGNSPKSDINPALEARMNAVFVPHPDTWRLEEQELRPVDGRQLLRIERFAELREHF
jgi:putative hydrolase of the HAD superfamily